MKQWKLIWFWASGSTSSPVEPTWPGHGARLPSRSRGGKTRGGAGVFGEAAQAHRSHAGARGTGLAGPLGTSPIPQERGEDAKRRRGVFREAAQAHRGHAGARGTGLAGPLGASPIPQERGEDAKRRRGVFGIRCLQVPPDRHPEPGVQVGEVNLTSGSSDARCSHLSGNVPSPCSMSIGSRKYKARHAPQTVLIVGLNRIGAGERCRFFVWSLRRGSHLGPVGICTKGGSRE
jgi:hypothetical protein